jgi:hypothetical protein
VIKGRVKTIIEQLDKSGLAADICKSKGSFKIKFRELGRKYAFDSQHTGFHAENPPNYYRFVKNDLLAIFYLVNPDGDYANKIHLTSKYLEIDEDAVEEFKNIWPKVLSYLEEKQSVPTNLS